MRTSTRVTIAWHAGWRARSYGRSALRGDRTRRAWPAGRSGAAGAFAVLSLAAIAATSVAGCGSHDGPASFLWHDNTGAVFVEWKRVGDDVSGSLSAAEVNQPQQGLFQAAAQPPGEITEQTGAFTGTVSDDSVRLQIGSGAASNRINGRLDGDTLELTLPHDKGVETVKLKPADKDDYAKAVQDIRDREARRQAAAKAAQARKQRADRVKITRVATAFQKALDPRSPDDPCRYLTPELRDDIVSGAEARALNENAADIPCKQAIRDSERERQSPLYTGQQGVASIRFLSSLIALRGIGQAGPPGAVVTWRPASGRSVLSQSQTSFAEQDGKWLVYRCCQ